MYIIKNAVRSIIRSPGRTVIICLIVLSIATACCVAISIQQSAQTARDNSRESLQIRGHIKADRKYVMETLQAANESSGSSDDSGDSSASLEETVKAISGLDLDELLVYAEAKSVDSFYYYTTISLSGDNGLSALNADDHSDIENAFIDAMPSGGPPGTNTATSVEDIMASINFGGDFILYGYSSDAAMEDFSDGTSYIQSGRMFYEGSTDYECIIDEELATYNGDLVVGDYITLSNPGDHSERFAFEIVGIYKNNEDTTGSINQTLDDPANHIYTSAAVVHDITAKSEAYRDPESVMSTKKLDDGTTTEQLLLDDGSLLVKGSEEEDSYENENALSETVVGTYVFKSIEDYDDFEIEAKEMGLSDKYTVTSSDVAAYEASLVPLDNLSTYANTFLYVVLAIGAIILVGVNVFNIRERKYEIGALTAMGMRKSKVAIQFILELTIVTFLGIALGSLLGSVVSTPIANTLLASQIQYEEENSSKMNEYFGRDVSGSSKPHGGDVEGEVEYVSSITFTFNYEIMYRMMLIGALLALVSSAAAILFVLQYDPLEILAERD